MAESFKSKLWWAVPSAALLLLTTLAMLFGGGPEPEEKVSSHSAARQGLRASYVLLEELDIPVARSRRPADGWVRWVLYPNQYKEAEVEPLRVWLERGGILVLADDKDDFARALGLERRADGEGWWERDGNPQVTIQRYGAGQAWRIQQPEIITNETIGNGDNAILVVRLAEAVLAEAERREGEPATILFDEYYHGLRDRPGVAEILFTPPMNWFTFAAFGFLGVLLWHAMPRFGEIQPTLPPRRRSKEEFLDAMAGLLHRNRDYADAYQTARAALIREVEEELGLPAGLPLAQVLPELRSRPGGGRLADLLATDVGPTGAAAFVHGLHQLQRARNEFWNGRDYS